MTLQFNVDNANACSSLLCGLTHNASVGSNFGAQFWVEMWLFILNMLCCERSTNSGDDLLLSSFRLLFIVLEFFQLHYLNVWLHRLYYIMIVCCKFKMSISIMYIRQCAWQTLCCFISSWSQNLFYEALCFIILCLTRVNLFLLQLLMLNIYVLIL